MHPLTTINQFIELRAQGISLNRIAEQLSVSKRTLVDWNRQHQADIHSLRGLELEALHEKVLASHEQELTRLAAFQHKLDDELANRSLEAMPTDKLLRLSLLVRREIRALCQSTQIKPDQAEPQSPEAPSSEDQSNQIKLNQAEPISPADTTDHGPPATDSPSSNPPTLEPRLPSDVTRHPSHVTRPPSDASRHTSHVTRHTDEHCLHCGDPLPPLLPDGTRPSPWCACGSPIAGPPGFSIRELCPVCTAPIPVHGYNIKRFSGKCTECHAILPNLDSNAPLKWLPTNSELQSLASALST